MFDSGISVKEMISHLKNEVDIAYPISDATYVSWLNSFEQFVYGEFIQEQRKKVIPYSAAPIEISQLEVAEDENVIMFEDIYTMFADETQLIKTSLVSSTIFPNVFFKTNNNIGYNINFEPENIIIIYFAKPFLIETDSYGNIINDRNVRLPIEFVELAKVKLRGEAYKLANEDEIAAKWINEYNILLETFKTWLINKSAEFGM